MPSFTRELQPKRTISYFSKNPCLYLAVSFLGLIGCGGGGGGSQQIAPGSVTSVTVTPGTGQLRTGDSLTFTAQVEGTGQFSTSVTWSVNGINGGNSSNGTIVGGQYTAPAVAPNPS